MEKVTTIKDIAKELGISTSTVSRILNGKNQRNEKLVAQVQEAAKRLNYQVNTTARGLRTNKSGLVGIIVPDIVDEFFASALSGIEKVAEERGYNLLLCQSKESNEKEYDLVKSLLACNVEGILVSVSQNTPDVSFLDLLKNSGKTAVLFDRTIEQDRYKCIKSNDYIGSYKAGEHLIQKGKKKFLYLGQSAILENDKQRITAYNDVLKEHGLPPCDTIYREDIYDLQAALADQFRSGKYDAVVTYYDMIAAEAMNFLKDEGIQVPEEVAVVGFDNRRVCRYLNPPLTSIDHPSRLMGEQALLTLLAELNDEEVEPVNLDTSLVVRGST